MKLALSGRLWESAQGYTSNFNEQIQIAADLGYDGIEMRYPLIPERNEWDATRQRLEKAGITLVFAPAMIPRDEAGYEDATRVLDALKAMGGSYLKVIPSAEGDVEVMRRVADLGAERGIKVASQLHANTMTDTVARTESFLTAANHDNLGLIFDACHIPFVEELPIDTAVQRLKKWIWIANVQSYKLAAEGDGLQRSNIGGRDWVLALPGDPEGTDLATSMRSLKSAGYDGWVTVMPAVDPTWDPIDVAKSYRDFLQPLL